MTDLSLQQALSSICQIQDTSRCEKTYVRLYMLWIMEELLNGSSRGKKKVHGPSSM